jgi:hypothetical protein
VPPDLTSPSAEHLALRVLAVLSPEIFALAVAPDPGRGPMPWDGDRAPRRRRRSLASRCPQPPFAVADSPAALLYEHRAGRLTRRALVAELAARRYADPSPDPSNIYEAEQVDGLFAPESGTWDEVAELHGIGALTRDEYEQILRAAEGVSAHDVS